MVIAFIMLDQSSRVDKATSWESEQWAVEVWVNKLKIRQDLQEKPMNE